MKSDPFFQLERRTFITPAGAVDLPILYYDFSQVIFCYSVEPRLLKTLLVDTGFEPCVFANGKAMAILVFFEYRDTSIGAYNEVGLCSATFSAKKRRPLVFLPDVLKRGEKWNIACFVHDLPVTTSLAHAAGRTLWGYPKFVTDIDFFLSLESFHGSIKDPHSEGEIMRIQGTLGKIVTPPILPAIDIVTHTIKNGEQIRTVITTNGKMRLHMGPPIQLKIGDSAHGMAQKLRHLGLHQKRPFAMATSYRCRSILPEGCVIS